MVRADTSAASQPHAVETKSTEGVTVCPFVVVVDSREQSPFTFQGLTIGNKELIVKRIVRGLATGDYSIEGMESRITIERKSADDLLGSIGAGHARFRREHERMRAMVEAGGFCSVVCEGGLAQIIADLEAGTDGRKLHPSSLLGIVASWPIRYGVQYDFAGSRRLAEQLTFWRLMKFWEQVKEDEDDDA